jgi:hypothetical protein
MRFISKYGRYGVSIQRMIEENYATGLSQTIQEPVYAIFRPEGLLPHEREMAIAYWAMNGFYQQEDEVSVFPPDYRIGVFDSVQAQEANSWSDELRIRVEETLKAHVDKFTDMLCVPETFVPAPWPRYDQFKGTPAQLVRRLVEDGHSIADTLEYERANQNREDVVAALEKLAADPELREEMEIVG